MLIPTKFTRLEESTLYKMRCIVTGKQESESVLDIYNRTKSYFYDASEFLHALDILFVLSLIDVADANGVVKYA
jgi:hypothetical protein